MGERGDEGIKGGGAQGMRECGYERLGGRESKGLRCGDESEGARKERGGEGAT